MAIWWTAPWAIASLEAAGFDYGITPLGNPIVGIKAYTMTSNAITRYNTPAALSLLHYLGTAIPQKYLSMGLGTIPANAVALNDPEVQGLYPVANLGEALNVGFTMGNSVYVPCQWDPVSENTMAIWNVTKTPEQAMSDAQADIEACIAGIMLL